jgi:class 3 adenylate cyclase
VRVRELPSGTVTLLFTDIEGSTRLLARASDAVAAAGEAQDALADGPVRVRIGIHTGEPVVTEEGYVGVDVHRAARVMGTGHGGQVLVSQTTRDLLDTTADLRDLGEHRLKDLTAPQRLYQLGNEDFRRSGRSTGRTRRSSRRRSSAASGSSKRPGRSFARIACSPLPGPAAAARRA